jgi:hypothetical protein
VYDKETMSILTPFYLNNYPSEKAKVIINSYKSSEIPVDAFTKDGILFDAQFEEDYVGEWVIYSCIKRKINGVDRQFREVLFHGNQDKVGEYSRHMIKVEDRHKTEVISC